MKEYYVWSDYGQVNHSWIVLAKNSKDAIQQIWDKYIVHINTMIMWNEKEIKTHDKQQLHARSLGSLHNEYGKIILLN